MTLKQINARRSNELAQMPSMDNGKIDVQYQDECGGDRLRLVLIINQDALEGRRGWQAHASAGQPDMDWMPEWVEVRKYRRGHLNEWR